MEFAIYSRKSKFTGKGESIGNQVELCREYLRRAYGPEAAEGAAVFEDEGFSGGNLNRPDFKRMMERAKKGEFRAIIVYRLDRISRNISDFSGLIQELARMGTDFISIREQFDTASPMGRAMMYIASVFSQLERETIAERIRDNMRELAKTGRWLGGTTPTGYGSESVKTLTAEGKTRKSCRLVLLPGEAETVRRIYEIFLQTESLTLTDGELLRRGIRSKNGREFTRFSIKGILQNPVYMVADEDAWAYFQQREVEVCSGEFDGVHGILAYNRTDQEKGRAARYLPVEEWIVCVGGHEGIIPGKLWVRAQEALERNREKAFRQPRKNGALLTGLLYCACGSRMYPKLTKSFSEGGEPVYSYVCKRKERSRRSLCDRPNARGNLLDREILCQLRELEEDRDWFQSRMGENPGRYTGDEGQRRLEDLRKTREEGQRRLQGLVDALGEAGTARELVLQRVEALQRELGQQDSQIRELEAEAGRKALTGEELAELAGKLGSFGGMLALMTVEQKRRALRAVTEQVIWWGDRAEVILLGAEGSPLPGADSK